MAIVGAGPAGLSCALWLTNLGYQPIVIECASQLCGMLRFNHHDNGWLLGFPGETGQSIGDKFLKHIQSKNIRIVTSALLTSIVQRNDGFTLCYTGIKRQSQVDADYLVIATGTRPRAPVELIRLASQFPDNFFIGAGALYVEDFRAGQHVAILGGGDNAFENAYRLALRGVIVDVYCRAEARARCEWQARCETTTYISIHLHASIGQFSVSGNQVSFVAKSKSELVDAVIVMYGYEPNTDTIRKISPWLGTAINEKGFIKVNAYQQVPIGRVYAIGDVTDSPLPCLPSAIGQGSTAAKAIALDAEGTLS